MFRMTDGRHRMPDGLPDREPTRKDLAAIEREWPPIERDLAVLDGQIQRLTVGDRVDELAVRRVRRARRRVLRVPIVGSVAGHRVWGGEVA